jgi:ATP adenylyltransferase
MAYIEQASRRPARGAEGRRARQRAAGKSGKSAPCLFCAFGRRRPAAGNLLLAETPLALVMLNLYPYNVGHVMVAPRRHKASPADLTAEEAVEIMKWLGRVERALKREYRPQGFNLGVNLGRPAGAGVRGHLHWHVVPRWNGDTNFMPVLGDTKVLPESLDRTYRRLRRALVAADSRRAR